MRMSAIGHDLAGRSGPRGRVRVRGRSGAGARRRGGYGSGMATPDLPLRLRTAAQPRRGIAVLFVAAIVWVFAGFLAYWLRTGLTVVQQGTVSSVGQIAWFAPLPIAFAIYLWATVGRCGPCGTTARRCSSRRAGSPGRPTASRGRASARRTSGECRARATACSRHDGLRPPRQRGRQVPGQLPLGRPARVDGARMVGRRGVATRYERVGGTGSTYRGCVLRMAGAPMGDLQGGAV